MTEPPGLTRRQFTELGLAGAALALLASCGAERTDTIGAAGSTSSTTGAVGPPGTLGSPSGPSTGEARSDVDRVAADPALTPAVVAATNRFATELYAQVSQGAENLAFSPLSIAIALAMTSEGARGTSRDQIEEVFHLTDVADPHGGWNAIDQALASRAGSVTRDDGTTDDLILAVVNKLWAQTGFAIEEPFLAVTSASYGAGVSLLDFVADPEAARLTINAWVAAQTNDRIPELIPPKVIDEYTRLVLTNAVYFKAPWASPFQEATTRDGDFTLLDGSTADVPLMSTEGRFATKAGDGWQAVELAYADEQLELLVIVPDAGRFADVEAQLGDGLLDEVPAGLEREDMLLTLPRFEIRTPLPLSDPLIAMGMPDPFDTDVADFSGINVEKGQELYIQDVIHEAFIAVDETGTEAAAATAVIIGEESARVLPEPVVVDRPFVWAIRDVPTNAVLFLGRVVDPSIPA
jgi:serpin B